MRARNVKPGLFLNEELGGADPLYTVIFVGLWCMADRDGRLEDRPMKIHMSLNPYRPSSSTGLALDWLDANGFICRYEADGTKCIEIPKFSDHQNPHVREKRSDLPLRSKSLNNHKHSARTVQEHEKHGSSTGSARLIPDSGFLIPDSPFPLPDSSKTMRAPDKYQIDLELAKQWTEHATGKGVDARTIGGQVASLAKIPSDQQADVVRYSIERGADRLVRRKVKPVAVPGIERHALILKLRTVHPQGIWRDNSWLNAEHAIMRLLDGGATVNELLEADVAYACQTEARGKVGTQYVLSPEAFFTKDNWRGPFPLPAATASTEPVLTWRPPADEVLR